MEVTSGTYTETVPCTNVTIDLCLNIADTQTTVPNTMHHDSSGNCLNIQSCEEILIYKEGTRLSGAPTSDTQFTGKIVCLSDKSYDLGTPFSVKIGSNDWVNSIGLAPLDISTALGFGK